MELSTTKTKLLAFNTSETEYANYIKLLSTIHIEETNNPFTDSAEQDHSVCVWQPPSRTPEAGEPQKSTKRHFVHWNLTPSLSQPSSWYPCREDLLLTSSILRAGILNPMQVRS